MIDKDMDFLVPFKDELELPYRTNKQLEDKIRYVFSHPKFSRVKREKFIQIDKKIKNGLVKDMACLAYGMAKHYIDNPSQYGHNIENIHWQLLWRMWRMTYKYRKHLDDEESLKVYMGAETKLKNISNGLVDDILRSVLEDDCIWTSDDMIKKRYGIGLRDRSGLGTHEGSDNFEYLCELGENECVGDEVANGELSVY